MSFSRRRLFGFLTEAAKGAASALGDDPLKPLAESPRETEALEAALEILATAGPEFGGGLSNHGPMVADALIALDRPEAIVPWVERYRRDLETPPTGRKAIEAAAWREAVGDYSRAGDWVVFFRREIAESSWKRVLSDWTVRLAPGATAAAFHGLLRTAHAVRSIGRVDTPARRRELADALAYWAARYCPLPDVAPWRTDRRLPSEALAEVRILEPEERKLDRGSISEAILALGYTASFAGVAGLVDSKVPGSELVSDMAETFARVYLAQATPGSGMALLHAVTGSSAARLLLPHLDERGRAVLLRFVWQAAAGIYAVFGRAVFGTKDAGEIPSPPLMGRESLIDRAVATGDEHAIKLAEACLRENAVMPRPVFLGAALDGTTRFVRG